MSWHFSSVKLSQHGSAVVVGDKVVFVGGKVVFVSVVVGLVASVVVVFDWASEPRKKIQGNLVCNIGNLV